MCRSRSTGAGRWCVEVTGESYLNPAVHVNVRVSKGPTSVAKPQSHTDPHHGFIVWASCAQPRQGFENARPEQRLEADDDDQEIPGREQAEDRTRDPCAAAIVRPGHRPRPRDEIRETWLRERRAARVRGEGACGTDSRTGVWSAGLPHEPAGSGAYVGAQGTEPDRQVPDRNHASSGSLGSASLPIVRPVRADGVSPSSRAKARSRIALSRTIWWSGFFTSSPLRAPRTRGPEASSVRAAWT